MARILVAMPKLGETAAEGTVVQWLKRPGELVHAEEHLLDVVTEKADVELPSPATGVLAQIVVPEGRAARPGDALGWIETHTSGDLPLALRHCEPCRQGTPALSGEELARLAAQVPGWTVVGGGKQVQRTFPFRRYEDGVTFTVAVARLAEQEDHHPDLLLSWGKVTVTFWTHTVGGLSTNDFILAAKVDALPRPAA